MAFFKFRKSGDDQAVTPPPSESIEMLRKRAKHRLIGTTILVLIGVIGFPLLVDKQPRPVAVDIPIEIPDKNKVKPLLTTQQQAQTPAQLLVAPAEPRSQASAEVKPKSGTGDGSAEKSVEQAVDKPAEKPVEQPVVTPAEKKPVDSGAKAKALLEDKAPPAEPAAGRFVVQVGAFAEVAKAREVRLKVERAGLKTYTHVAETKDGQRTRVRVGPFATRAEAEKAAEKIKKLDLPAIILTL